MNHEARSAVTWRALMLGAIALAAVVLGACGSSTNTASTSGASTGAVTTASASGGKTVSLTLTDAGCTPKAVTVPAGSTTFEGTGGSAKVTEFEVLSKSGLILGERENLTPGLKSSFSLDLQPGDYDISCSIGDHKPTGTLTVTGTRTTTTPANGKAELAAAVAGYKAYVTDQVLKLQSTSKQFVAALKAGDTQKAKDLFARARVSYEAIEPVAESFGDLDPRIDARVNDVAKGDKWTGFHKIEQILWKNNTTDGTAALGTQLLADIDTLDAKSKTLEYQAPQVANGAVGLLNEVSNSKISGEEDRYSHTDLSDFKANVDGAQKAFELLVPVLNDRGSQALVKTLVARFSAVSDALAPYERPDEPSGWAVYSELTAADRKKLSQAVDALAEPLSTVASKVSATGNG